MAARPPVFPRSGLIVQRNFSIDALVPTTLISQVESLLDNHKIADAVELANQRRRKIEGSLIVEEGEVDELRYVNQRIGVQCFKETLFEDAGKYLSDGELDPRLLVSYFPEVCGSLFLSTEPIDTFAGVADQMPKDESVKELKQSPLTAELQSILGTNAMNMLESFLKRWKKRRQVDPQSSGGRSIGIDTVVDTVLCKLYALTYQSKELQTLMEESNAIITEEVKSVLHTTGHFKALCVLYKRQNNDTELLETWSRLAEGQYQDDSVKDPILQMVSLLEEKHNKDLTLHWGLWLIKRNPERGLKLLMPLQNGKRRDKQEEDLSLYEKIKDANTAAGTAFLEHLVLEKNSTSRAFNTRLALVSINQVLEALTDDAVSKLWRAKASSYASSSNESSFLAYFVSTTPDSIHKRTRIKTILLLAGSDHYDFEDIRQRITQRGSILTFELAILDSKLSRHRSALSLLAKDLHDVVSAETYCTLGGNIVSPRAAQSILDNYGLEPWASFFCNRPSTKSGVTLSVLKRELTQILLEIYMENDISYTNNIGRLLNTQAMNLDILDVIARIPPTWPLSVMSTFLARSFRRSQHVQREGNIVKNMSSGQNLEVKDRTWRIFREEGAFVEECLDDSDEYDEKAVSNEKDALPLSVVDISVDADAHDTKRLV